MQTSTESLLRSAERRLEARTQAKLQSIQFDFSRRLESFNGGSSSVLKAQKANTEREMQSAIRQVERTHESQKRQFELLGKGGQTERLIRGKGRKRTDAGMDEQAQMMDIDSLKKLSYLSDLARDVRTTIQGHCFRLQHMQQMNSIKEVMLYLSLRSQGCPRQNAINFANKLRCRIDSTQTNDGPSSMRTIRRLNNMKDGVNVNGWQLHSPKYRLKSEFQPYKMKEDEIDYEAIKTGYERFERGHRVVNGEVMKKDPIMDFELEPSQHVLQALPKHRRVISLPTTQSKSTDHPSKSVLKPIPDAKKDRTEAEKYMFLRTYNGHFPSVTGDNTDRRSAVVSRFTRNKNKASGNSSRCRRFGKDGVVLCVHFSQSEAGCGATTATTRENPQSDETSAQSRRT